MLAATQRWATNLAARTQQCESNKKYDIQAQAHRADDFDRRSRNGDRPWCGSG